MQPLPYFTDQPVAMWLLASRAFFTGRLWLHEQYRDRLLTAQGYDVLEDMMSPRTSASNFVMTIASKRAKQHLTPLMARLVEVMNTYAAAGETLRRFCCQMVLLQLPVTVIHQSSWGSHICDVTGHAVVRCVEAVQ
jgi:hypothetical protein